jgi:uncharacterized protein YggE
MMRFLTLVAFSLLTLGSIPMASAQDRMPNLITVTGEGEVAIVPDLAILGAGVTTTGKTARETSEANAKLMGAVMGVLKGAGIADQDMQTSRLSLQPVRDNRNNEFRVTGFQANNQVSVKIRDLTKISDLVDRVVAAGANDISGVQFVVSSQSKLLDQARRLAIADAKRKADTYAKAANVILGAPISIIEEGAELPGPLVMMRTAKAEAVTPISPGEQVKRISVSVSYELQR